MNNLNITLPYSPFPYQEEFHLANKRYRVIAGGRRVGKSQSALQELIRHCLTYPNRLAWWVAPTYRDAREVGWDMMLTLIPDLQPAIKKVNHSHLTITFINDSKILFKGSDNENSLRGRGLTAVVLDEAAFIKQDVWTKAIRPALSDKKGWAVFTSTPNGRNWYFKLYQHANYPSNGTLHNGLAAWKAYHWPTSNNPIIDEDELEDAKQGLSTNDYRQEYLAEFITKAGMVYDDFTSSNIIDSIEASPSTHTFYLGMDFGYVNPTAITLMAVDNTTEWVYQIDELYISRHNMEQIDRKIKDMLASHNLHQSHIRMIYTDPAGNADELSSGISPVDYLRREGWTVENKGTLVAPGLALVRSYILNAKGERRFYIHKRCTETIRSMYGYCYKLGPFNQPTEEPDKDNDHDHACDAVRYFFVNRFDHAKYIFSSLVQDPYGLDSKPNNRTMKRCGDCRKKFLSMTSKYKPPFLCNACLSKKQQELITNAN